VEEEVGVSEEGADNEMLMGGIQIECLKNTYICDFTYIRI